MVRMHPFPYLQWTMMAILVSTTSLATAGRLGFDIPWAVNPEVSNKLSYYYYYQLLLLPEVEFRRFSNARTTLVHSGHY